MRRRILVTSLAAIAVASVALSGQVIQRDSRDPGGAAPAGTGVISGTILTDESTPQPMRRARVSLTTVTDGAAGGVANVPVAGGFGGGGGRGGGGGGISNVGSTGGRNVVTDDTGRFTFDKLPAGRYSLAANKPGYLRLAYGAKRQDGAGTVITLGDGQQMTSLSIRLPRGSVITGRIIDAGGEPAFGVYVRAMRSRMQGADRTFTPVALANNDQTDDRGIYRLYGLPPGDYVLVATPRDAGNGDIRAMTDAEIRAALAEAQQPPSAAGRTGATAPPPAPDVEPTMIGFAPVYYPGTTNAASVATITLGAGEERTGVDLQLQNVRTAKIEGTVVIPAGVSHQNVQLTMIQSGAATMVGGPMLMNRTQIQPDGKFTYTGVTPGQYVIAARSGGGRQMMMIGGDVMTMSGAIATAAGPGRAGGEGASANAPAPQVLWGQADLNVEGRNIDGVVITLQPGMTIAGRIAFDAAKTTAPTDLSRARIQLLPAQSGNTMTMAPGAAEVDATGKFTLTGVTPGKYRFSAGVPPAPGTLGQWILKSATVGSRDALDGTLDIAPSDSPGEAVLTFTDQTQDVSGMLQDASGRAAPDYTIVVFAADRKYWTAASRRVKTARPSTDGRFTVTGLPAGAYRLAALTDIVQGDQNDPAFLEQLVAASIAFTLAPGEKHVQDLRIGG